MIEITWRYEPADQFVEPSPHSWTEAVSLIDQGNAAFARLGGDGPEGQRLVLPVTPEDLGLGHVPGEAPRQAPFAALVGCADARVPLELLMSQSANDVFVVRVAGNVLANEGVGSLDYAVAHLSDLRLLGVIGHTGCGAVGAAVDSYLQPVNYLGVTHNLPLRSIIDALMASVRGADVALKRAHGADVTHRPNYRAALADTAVVLNAAVAADCLRTHFAAQLSPSLGVVFGVYDLASRVIGIPAPEASSERWQAGLLTPPSGAEFIDFIGEVVRSGHIISLLNSEPAAAH